MRRIRYQVACSLDGYIAGPQGEYDWIIMDPDIDFDAHFRQFDTLLMGRHTFAIVPAGESRGQRVIVVSTTLRQADHPQVTVISEHLEQELDALRREPGADIWLYGGGQLFRSLLELDQVDTVELAVIPVMLGGGIPFLPPGGPLKRLSFTSHHVYPKSGIVMLNYDIVRKPQKKTRAAKTGAR